MGNCWGNVTNCGGMTFNGLVSHPGGVEILLATSCYMSSLPLCTGIQFDRNLIPAFNDCIKISQNRGE